VWSAGSVGVVVGWSLELHTGYSYVLNRHSHKQTYTHSMDLESRMAIGCEKKLQNTKQTGEYNSYFKGNIQLNSSTTELTLSRPL